MTMVKRMISVGVAVAALAGSLTATTSPAAAWGRGGWGGPFAAGIIGGLATGAILGSARPSYGYYGYGPNYGYAPVYNPCYRSQTPVYDVDGNYVGMRTIRTCD